MINDLKVPVVGEKAFILGMLLLAHGCQRYRRPSAGTNFYTIGKIPSALGNQNQNIFAVLHVCKVVRLLITSIRRTIFDHRDKKVHC